MSLAQDFFSAAVRNKLHGFNTRLISVALAADSQNLALLEQVYPEVVETIRLWRALPEEAQDMTEDAERALIDNLVRQAERNVRARREAQGA